MKLDITANAFSDSAREKITAAGGIGHRAVTRALGRYAVRLLA